MKYIDKFPDMKPIFDECEGVIRGGDMKPCAVCGRPTEFIEINYEAHLRATWTARIHGNEYKNTVL